MLIPMLHQPVAEFHQVVVVDSSTKRRVVHFSNCRRACLCDFNVSGSNVTSMLCSRLSIASEIVIRSAFFFNGSGRSKPSAASSRCRSFALAAFTASSKFPLTLCSRFLPPPGPHQVELALTSCFGWVQFVVGPGSRRL